MQGRAMNSPGNQRGNAMRWAVAAALLGFVVNAWSMNPLPKRQEQDRLLAQAEAQAGSGQFAQAAQSYETLAAQAGAEMKNRLLLRAARYWLSADDTDKARAALEGMSKSLPASDAALRATVAADLALRTRQPDRALVELDRVAVPLPNDLAPEILRLRSAAHFALNHPIPAINGAIERERFLGDAAALTQNRESMWAGLKQSAANGADLTPPAGVDQLVAGWLDLARSMTRSSDNPFASRDALSDWRKRYPGHPAGTLGELQILPGAVAVPTAHNFPAQIALLLPLSGRQQSAGVAIRDGFMAALMQQSPETRPIVNVYDTQGQSAVNVYQQALGAGATFVVGPLLKEEVNALAQSPFVAVPTLALNLAADVQTPPGLMFQFALDPEEESRQVAQRILNDGRRRGIALAPNNDWGQRVIRAFDAELKAQGGGLAGMQLYESNARDYSNVIMNAMLINESRARAKALASALGVPLETEARSRGDVEFVFIAAQPAQGRVLRPALRFYIADQSMPVYATSDIYAANEQANSDLDGVRFPDMPWMIDADGKAAAMHAAVRNHWPNATGTRDRLYAFGYDAFQLVPTLSSQRPQAAVLIDGMTGKLAVDDDGHVRRQLDWAQISRGAAVPLPLDAPPSPAQ